MLTDHKSYSGIHHFTVATLEKPEFPPHIHLSFELISVLEGSIDLLINGRGERLSAGQSALIFPHQIHSVQSENARLRHCTFSPFLAISYYTYHKNLRPDSNRFELPSLLMQIFMQLKQEDHYYAHKGFLYQMLVAFEQGRTYSPADTSSQSLTVKILTFIEANYMEECTLEKLAAALGYDPNYLSQTFHRNVGVHFKEYVTFFRLNRACYLLEHSTLSILACAEEAGFASLRSFNRNFKLRFGLTPKEHRSRHQKQTEAFKLPPPS